MIVSKKYLIILTSLLFLLQGCSSVKEGLSLKKKANTDEFLVQKKEPLTMPPDFDKLPLPNSVTNKSDLSEEEKIKKIIKLPKENLNKNKKSSTIEDSIIEQIR